MTSNNRQITSMRGTLLALILVLVACTPAAMHRPESVLEKDDFTLTFIEFDDQGEPWAPAQALVGYTFPGEENLFTIERLPRSSILPDEEF